jgi:hypothetical protein
VDTGLISPETGRTAEQLASLAIFGNTEGVPTATTLLGIPSLVANPVVTILGRGVQKGFQTAYDILFPDQPSEMGSQIDAFMNSDPEAQAAAIGPPAPNPVSVSTEATPEAQALVSESIQAQAEANANAIAAQSQAEAQAQAQDAALAAQAEATPSAAPAPAPAAAPAGTDQGLANADAQAAADASGGGGGGKVLCTAYFDMGMIPRDVFKADCYYARDRISRTTLRGYQLWATPLVKTVKSVRVITWVFRPFVTAWANQMAYEMGTIKRWSPLG